jgi:hypothetical protein
MELIMKTQHSILAYLLVAVLVALSSTSPAKGQTKEYSGSGDDIVILEKPDEGLPALLVVSGNSQSRHFSITSYSSSRERIDLLINSTEPYSGIVAVDLPVGTETGILEITATGSWSIDVYHIGAAPKISVENPKSDSGDNVLWIEGDASIATITGNSSERHFSIKSYNGNGNYSDLLVNTTDRYSGKVLLPKHTLLLQISAVGSWSIELQ